MRLLHLPSLLLIFIALSLTAVQAAPAANYEKLATIKSIISSADNQDELVVKLSAPATYTSYKANAPLRFVVDLSQTTQGNITLPQIINRGNIKTVTASQYDTDAGVLTRVDIEMVNDAKPVITATPNTPGELRIQLAPVVTSKQIMPETPKESTTPATVAVTQKVDINVSTHLINALTERDGAIVVSFTGGTINYKTTRYGNPERLVLDLADSDSAMATNTMSLQSMGGVTATVGRLPGKVRLIFEPLHGSMPDFALHVADGQLIITAVGGVATKPYKAENTKPVHEEANTLKLTATRSGVKKQDLPEAVVSQRSGPKTLVFPVVGTPQVEMIDFQMLENVSRISIKVSGDVKTEQPVRGNGFISLILKNTNLPKNLQRSLETQAFDSPVLRVTPMTLMGRNGSDTQVKISLKVAAEHSFRREGDMFFVDVLNPKEMPTDRLVVNHGLPKATPNVMSERYGERKLTGRNVTLDFDNAEIRHIFRLLADVSQRNFIVGDDVTGTISVKLTNVPWEQALEIILDSKGLVMREHGNVVSIMTKNSYKAKTKEELELQEQKKQAEKEKSDTVELATGMYSLNYSELTAVVAQLNNLKSKRGSISSDMRTNKIIATDLPENVVKMDKLIKLLDVPEKQVMIEARIVEATSTFTQSLGVNWGVHYRDGSAALLGINQLDSSFGGITTTAPPLTGVGGQAGGVAGISFGTLTSNIQLDLRLNAAASAGLIKIVSTPKVATLNNKTAKITQGQQVPYTSSTADKVETKFVEAALSLEVTPHINSNGTIGMKIDAKNDSVGQATGGSTAPSINKKQATTEMLLRDGETTVIGGIYVDNDVESDDGVPYLMEIPYLGKLFRSNNKTKIKSELLIFITPRILGDV